MSLARALEWKYGPVADTAGNEITAWRDPRPQPNQAEVDALLVEYENRDKKAEMRAKVEAELNDPIRGPIYEAIREGAQNKGQLIASAKAKVK